MSAENPERINIKENMEYGKIIKDALSIAWRKRHLWAFGFFAGIGAPNLDSRLAADKLGDAWEWMSANPGLMLMLAVLGLCVALVFWVLQIVSQGGLAKGVADIELAGAGNFEAALSHGLGCFWRVLGLQLLLLAVVVAAVLVTVVPPSLLIALGGTGAKVAGIVWLAVAILPVLAGLVALGLLWNYALRHCVLGGQGVFRSISSSWSLVRTDFSESVILFGIGFGIGLVLGIAAVLALVLLAIPFVILGIINLALGLVPGLAIGIPAFILTICILGVFQSAFWTLGFLRLPSNRRLAEAAPLP